MCVIGPILRYLTLLFVPSPIIRWTELIEKTKRHLDRANNRCRGRVTVLISKVSICGVPIVVEITVVVVTEQIRLAILMVSRYILLSFVLREILGLVKLLLRCKEMLQEHKPKLNRLELLHRVLMDKIDRVRRLLK
ncbi:hypothetical protein P3L10_007516 [Capsicum annuum]